MDILTIENRKNSILIVDDENANLKVLTHILGKEYTIYTATSGKSAIEKAKEYKPDLILLDILMPEMDGYATLAELKKCENVRQTPVIFITGLDRDEDEEKGLSLEAADYITKPLRAMIVKLRVHNQMQIINQMHTIERLSMIDQLTNIPNRRSFDERLRLEWKLASREQTQISLLMMDIDNFKVVNDTYGHLQGDIVLQTVARIFPASFKRPSDFAARWGGEEFIVLLPNTPLEGALDVAEKIRKDIEGIEILYTDGSYIKITVSIGVCTQVPTIDSSLDAFLSNVDKALYKAKNEGRNRVEYFF
ncbi:MAG: diguanylate cyclase [Treponema sp.]|jgi:diguanylate cyclase (GGDEF)-like protein|nr:diguanylate cyclase [Treponema sp.]